MNIKRFAWGLGLALVVSGAWLLYQGYGRFVFPNVDLPESSVEFKIHSDWTYADVYRAIREQNIVRDTAGFNWVAHYKKYDQLVKAGRYIITDGMSNNALVNLLRSGEQEPERVVIRSVRDRYQLASIVSRYLEADSAEFISLINDANFCDRFGFTTTTIVCLFIPNTYEIYWNTSAEEFIQRMAKEYKRFWNDDRKARAQRLGLSQSEVCTLASIVQSEQAAHPDERPVVAGLYLNRLRKGMRLESDPTLIHAIGDYTIKRVLNVHKEIDSPYNTYKRAGLPPGPILLPETTSIDAVLQPAQHHYIFMCAKEDFSGYHHFSTNYNEHINNARRYQKALNARKIYK